MDAGISAIILRPSSLLILIDIQGMNDGISIIDVTDPENPSCCFYAHASGKCTESSPSSVTNNVGPYYEVEGDLEMNLSYLPSLSLRICPLFRR
jgi:hypothetical protein